MNRASILLLVRRLPILYRGGVGASLVQGLTFRASPPRWLDQPPAQSISTSPAVQAKRSKGSKKTKKVAKVWLPKKNQMKTKANKSKKSTKVKMSAKFKARIHQFKSVSSYVGGTASDRHLELIKSKQIQGPKIVQKKWGKVTYYQGSSCPYQMLPVLSICAVRNNMFLSLINHAGVTMSLTSAYPFTPKGIRAKSPEVALLMGKFSRQLCKHATPRLRLVLSGPLNIKLAFLAGLDNMGVVSVTDVTPRFVYGTVNKKAPRI